MTHTRLDLPTYPGRHRRPPWWLAPVCALICLSPVALAAGAGAAWLEHQRQEQLPFVPAVTPDASTTLDETSAGGTQSSGRTP